MIDSTVKVMLDSRMNSKIEELIDLSQMDINCYSIKFKDLEDTFFFTTKFDLQEFLRKQEVERFYDKSLRKGYFDYVNENNETLRYHVESTRGKLTLLKDECLGAVSR